MEKKRKRIDTTKEGDIENNLESLKKKKQRNQKLLGRNEEELTQRKRGIEKGDSIASGDKNDR